MAVSGETLGEYVDHGRTVKGSHPPLRRKYLWAIETARDLLAANQDPKQDLRRQIMFALRRCGPISTVDLIELLIVTIDSDEDLEVIADALKELAEH